MARVNNLGGNLVAYLLYYVHRK